MTLLTNRQKQVLAGLARRAFALECARARGRGESPGTGEAEAAAFRHAQVALACGQPGLRGCTQADYAVVKARLEDLLDEPGRALETLLRGAGNDRRVAEYKLREALRAARLPVTYAAKICRSQYQCSLADANARQLWRVMFTIRNRGRRRAAAGEPGPDAAKAEGGEASPVGPVI